MRRQPAQVMVLFGLAITGLVALVALVLDGGNVYLQHRTAQASADAAALAGTSALRSANNSTPVSTIAAAVKNYAEMNAFGPTPRVTCATFIDKDGNSLSAMFSSGMSAGCASYSGSIPSTAAGVHVEVHIAFSPYLIGMLQNVCGTFCTNPTADARASAMVGVLTAYDTRNAPIIVCGGGTTGNHAAGPRLFTACR